MKDNKSIGLIMVLNLLLKIQTGTCLRLSTGMRYIYRGLILVRKRRVLRPALFNPCLALFNPRLKLIINYQKPVF